MTSASRILRTLACAIAIVTAGAARAAGDERVATATRTPLPANLILEDSVRQWVDEAVALSPTLRRQLAVLDGAPVVVDVRVTLAPFAPFRRALTTVRRYEFGFLRAAVLLPSSTDFVELLAHELEHVVEQIEGVDLAALVRTGRATTDIDGVFETVRAREAGRAAALEVEQARAEAAH
jgi:hypothetical protein